MSGNSSLAKGIITRSIQVLVYIVLQALILFAASGDLAWTWAWVYLGVGFLSTIVSTTFLFARSPETIAERGHPERGETWDKRVSGLWGILQFIVLPLVAALDARLRWDADPDTWVHLLGTFFYAIGLALFGWAMISNAYFSTTVRIQKERGHKVCRTGPYNYIRHPGYTGTICQSLGIPALLGSVWALIPALLAVVLIVIRTSLEDRLLSTELEAYSEYAHETRYRLIPGVW
jgi:protein-S-isoprenylcysteine O-methyltransferase Ste14